MRTRSKSRRGSHLRLPDLTMSGVRLPADVFILILGFLPRCAAVRAASLVSKAWLAATRDPVFWRTLDGWNGLSEQSRTVRNMTSMLELLSRRQFSALRSLTPPDRIRMRKNALVCISKACPMLEEIDLGFSIWSAMRASVDDLLSLPALFPCLESVRLNQWKVTNVGIVEFCKRMGDRLKSIRINSLCNLSESLTDDDLDMISHCCPNLKQFEYGSYMLHESALTERGIAALLEKGAVKNITIMGYSSFNPLAFARILEDASIKIDRLFIVDYCDTILDDAILHTRLGKTALDFRIVDAHDHYLRIMFSRTSEIPHIYW